MGESKDKTYYKRNLPHYQPEGYTYFVTFRLAGSLPVAVIKKLKEDREKELKLIAGITLQKQKAERYYESQRKYFGVFDRLLDNNKNSPMWLRDEKIAEIVKEAIHFRDKKEYKLVAYTIMPNHVHLIFTPITIMHPQESVMQFTESRKEPEMKTQYDNENAAQANISRIGDSSYKSDYMSDKSNVNRFAESINEHKQNSQNSVSSYIVTKILQELKKHTAFACNKLLKRSGAFWHHESYDHVVRNIEELKRIVSYVLQNPVKAKLVENSEEWNWSYFNPKYLV